MPEKTKISHSVEKTLLGLDATYHSDPQKAPDNTSFVSKYTKAEGAAITRALYAAPQERRSTLSAAGIIAYLKPKHVETARKRLNTEKMKALAPEISQSKLLMSACIMNPNDLQDGSYTFNFDGVPAVEEDEDLAKAVAEYYSDYFNGTLDLGVKSGDWIGEILYETGAHPVLILPIATQEEIKHRTPEDAANSTLMNYKIGMSAFDQYSSQLADADYFFSGKPYTWKDEFSKKDPSSMLKDMIPSMESFGVNIPTEFRTDAWLAEHKEEDRNPEYFKALEELVVNVKTKLQEGDVLKVSENPEILRFNTIHSLQSKEEISKKLTSRYFQQQQQPGVYVEEPFISLKPNPQGYKHRGHPTIIELPVESVMPIIVEGTPQEHLGYFIILDENGQPLTAQKSGVDQESAECAAGSVASAYNALFGSGNYGAIKYYGNGADISTNAGQMIFDNLVEGYIKNRIKGIFGRTDLTIARTNTINEALFYRLLKRKHTTLVFAPTDLLHYFAFAYRPSGTGSAQTDEIEFLLSLRTTFMIANVMAAARNAVEHRQIKFTPSDQETNIEGFMDDLNNVFNAKQKSAVTLDPSEIMGDLYTNATTFVPTKIPGMIDSLEIEAERINGGANSPVDEKLLEDLTNLTISGMDVPPQALSQISEPEFMRSIVTTNLFFANKVRRRQRIWCGLMTDFIKFYTYFDPEFQKGLVKVVSSHGKKHANTSNQNQKTKELAENNPNQYSDASKLVSAILDNVEVSLPTPNIAMDKTQFNEIREYVGSVNEIADLYFPDDLAGNDEAAQNGLRLMKANWKREQFNNFINEIGSFKMVDLKDLDDIGDGGDIVKFIQVAQNLNKHIEAHNQAISNFPNQQADYGGDTFGGGDTGMGGDEFGSMDMGGEGMDNMEGADMSMDSTMSGGDTGEAMDMPENPSAEESGEGGDTFGGEI